MFYFLNELFLIVGMIGIVGGIVYYGAIAKDDSWYDEEDYGPF